jgi:ABC-type Fe3+ transport system permease subunit
VTGPAPSEPTRDLAGQAMSWIDQVVDTLHDKVIRPILLVGRSVAFSFIIAFSVIVIAVALAVALLRLLDVYVFPNHQWASWALLGLLSLVAGLVIWRQRSPVPTKSPG